MEREEALKEIAAQLQWWLAFNEASLLGKVSDDTHVMPPEWPTRGMLQNWIDVLHPDS